MNAPAKATEIRLAARPHGTPTLDDFSIVDTEVPAAGPGEILVRNLVLSVDPYMRGRMSDAKSYAAPYEVGKVMHGGALGEVVESTVDTFKPGDVVLHQLGWRTHAVLDAKKAVRVDPEAAPLNAYLGVLGMTGLTAYSGLFRRRRVQGGRHRLRLRRGGRGRFDRRPAGEIERCSARDRQCRFR